jgi:hypothetical protein
MSKYTKTSAGYYSCTAPCEDRAGVEPLAVPCYFTGPRIREGWAILPWAWSRVRLLQATRPISLNVFPTSPPPWFGSHATLSVPSVDRHYRVHASLEAWHCALLPRTKIGRGSKRALPLLSTKRLYCCIPSTPSRIPQTGGGGVRPITDVNNEHARTGRPLEMFHTHTHKGCTFDKRVINYHTSRQSGSGCFLRY